MMENNNHDDLSIHQECFDKVCHSALVAMGNLPNKMTLDEMSSLAMGVLMMVGMLNSPDLDSLTNREVMLRGMHRILAADS